MRENSETPEDYYARRKIELLKMLANGTRLFILIVLEIARRVFYPSAGNPSAGNPSAGNPSPPTAGLSYSGLKKSLRLVVDNPRSTLNHSLRVLVQNQIIEKKIAPGEIENTHSVYYLTEYGQWLVANIIRPNEDELQELAEELRSCLSSRT